MAVLNRQTLRDEVAAGLAGLALYQTFHNGPPLQLAGESPVGSIHVGGSLPNFISANVAVSDHSFIVTHYVSRSAHGADESENILDALYTAVVQWVRDNPTGAAYEFLRIADRVPSRPGFAIIDGVPYRTEEIQLTGQVLPTG